MKRLFISAFEPSAEVIAAEVAESLKRLQPDLEIQGIDGIFPPHDLAVMGFAEVLPKLLLIKKRLAELTAHIITTNPDMVITTDAYSFHILLAKKLRQQGYQGKLIQLVAPAVWAWKPSRAQKLARYYDGVLCVLPIEPPFFQKVGLRAQFIGNPAIFRVNAPDPTFRKRHGISKEARLLTILPGSRAQEIHKLLPLFLEAASTIAHTHKNVQIVIPTFPAFMDYINGCLQTFPHPVTILQDPRDKRTCFHESWAAIAASGTVALELSADQVPFVIAYKTSPLTYWGARLLAKVKHICLINILLGKRVVPELLQKECSPEKIVESLLGLLESKQQKLYLKEIGKALALLQPPAPYRAPAEAAAAFILEMYESILLSNEDRDLILNMLDNPPEPNEALKKAMRKYRDTLK